MKLTAFSTLIFSCFLTMVLASPVGAQPSAAGQSLLHGQPQSAAKINLVWDHIYDASRNQVKLDKIDGLDIVSPTWFAVVDETGLIHSKADIGYVNDAHSKGYKVWALVSNSFNPDLTHSVLASSEAQENIIRQLLEYAAAYKLDGINIDFENIYENDKDRFSEFVEKLAKRLKEKNLTVSIDVTVPSNTPNWSKCYDRKRLGAAVDYVMVMTYDEHWRKSPVSGSVASLPWVEKGIQNTLALVPREKVLLGIPFYTREWEESIDAAGKKTVSAKTMTMAAVQQTIDEHNLHPVWLPDAGQYYVEYEKNNKTYKIWIENAHSIALKTELVHKYGLAGVASWRKGFEAKHIWNILNNNLRNE